jgi:hypothetical protein
MREDTHGHRRAAAVAALALVAGAAAAVVVRSTAPPATPPEYREDRPEPAVSGYASHTESTSVAVPRAAFLDWSSAQGLQDVIETGGGAVPAVVATVPLRGDWEPTGDSTGDRRRVAFADGHFLAEEVLADTPDRFRYMIWGFTGYQRFAVGHGVAEFRFAERPGGTEVTWTYSLLPTTRLMRPFVERFLRRSMAPMMRATLAATRARAERDLSATPR